MNIVAYDTKRPEASGKLENAYFQGNVRVDDNSALIGSDVRNDEHNGIIDIKNSGIYGVVHCTPGGEVYNIKNTIAQPGSIGHGGNLDSVVLGVFSTIDVTDAENLKIGGLSYLLSDKSAGGGPLTEVIPKGSLIINKDGFYFRYDMSKNDAEEAIQKREALHDEYLLDQIYEGFHEQEQNSFIHPYTTFGYSKLGGRNFIAQRAVVLSSIFGEGSNVQEKCIAQNVDAGNYNIFAHGATGLNLDMGSNCFLMFNTLVENAELDDGVILLPNTTVAGSPDKRLYLSPGIYCGMIRNQQEADKQREAFDDKLQNQVSAQRFYKGLSSRIEHILELNGGLPGVDGHAQNHHALKYERI